MAAGTHITKTWFDLPGFPIMFACWKIVVGVLLRSFLVWLWLWWYLPEDEVGVWLNNNGLVHLIQDFQAKGEELGEGGRKGSPTGCTVLI